jgi:c-di-GMP-binding flagellar brake protein YcgR
MGFDEYRQGYTIRLPDRRADPRYSVDENAVVQVVGSGTPMPGTMIDLSQEGCRVRTREQLSARAQSRVEICFKVNGIVFRFSGVVVGSDSRNLLGIRFVNMISRRRAALAAVIDEMEAAAAARAEAVNKLVAEQEAPAQAKWEAKESTERQNREPARMETNELPQPTATAVPAATGEPDPSDAKPRDRRRQVRHEVDTFAKILLVNVGSVLRGKILDLSLSGCRIRTDVRFPVGIYTRVETEFQLEGMPFRLGGVIQAIHGRNTVGIRFLDLSERKRQQVVELIGEIQLMRKAQSA